MLSPQFNPCKRRLWSQIDTRTLQKRAQKRAVPETFLKQSSKQLALKRGDFVERNGMWAIDLSSLRPAPSVTAQRHIDLFEWRVLELAEGSRILAGLLPGSQTMRHTTPIKCFDPVDRHWVTQSGRKYYTVGEPTQDLQLMIALRLFTHACGATGEINDVTDEYWIVMKRSIQ